MAELADAPDLGSGGLPVQVQVLLPAPGRAWTQAASRARFFYFAFSLAFVAGIYFVTQTHVGAKSALLLFSNCDPLRWVRSWRAALRAAFTLGLYLFRQRMAKRKIRREVCLSFWVLAAEGVLHSFDFKCSGEMNSPCAKVFAAGENACTARTRRPAVRGPNQCPHLFLQCTAHRSKRYALAPVFQKTMHAHILPLLPSAMQLVTSSRSSAAHSGSALDRSGKTSYNTKAIRV